MLTAVCLFFWFFFKAYHAKPHWRRKVPYYFLKFKKFLRAIYNADKIDTVLNVAHFTPAMHQ